jgi:hypothetical protein
MSDEPDSPDKVVLELRKLRWELSFWARAAAVAVPIAAFVVAAAQTYIAVQDSKSKDLLALRDLELKRIESGEKLVEFTNAQTELLLSTDLEKRTQALTYASTLLPPQQACMVINAVIIASPGHADFIAPAQHIRALIVKQHPELLALTECTDDAIFDTQNEISIAVAQAKQESQSAEYLPAVAPGPAPPPPPPAPPPMPTAAPSPVPTAPAPTPQVMASAAPKPARAAPPVIAAAAPACPRPGDTATLPLVVYYQIVQADDRPAASRIGFEMPTEFPSAGIELVPATTPARQTPQVRYYRAEQKSAAEWLACMLTEAYAKVTGSKPRVNGNDANFAVVPLAGRYKGLPAHRAEVWFPAIKQSN